MRIAVVAPLIEPVPPKLYGGTERVVSALTEELVRRGREVTLFASGDSETSARLVACSPQSLRLSGYERDTLGPTLLQLGEVYRRAEEFDVIHNHLGSQALPFARMVPTPTITTTHGRLDLPGARRLYSSFHEQPLVSISNAQREPLPTANWVATVYNGMDLSRFHFRSRGGDYLVFLGRISPEKRPDRAIEVARDLGMRLVIAAKVDPVDEAYYQYAIVPMIRSSSLIEFIGEVDDQQKDALLGGASTYLFPIDWPEPFGLTLVEAMATGTPVVAYGLGSVPEIVVNGQTGFICQSFREMIEAVQRVGTIDRRRCRAHVEGQFSAAAMADGYERVYGHLVEADPVPTVAVPTEVDSAPAELREVA